MLPAADLVQLPAYLVHVLVFVFIEFMFLLVSEQLAFSSIYSMNSGRVQCSGYFLLRVQSSSCVLYIVRSSNKRHAHRQLNKYTYVYIHKIPSLHAILTKCDQMEVHIQSLLDNLINYVRGQLPIQRLIKDLEGWTSNQSNNYLALNYELAS